MKPAQNLGLMLLASCEEHADRVAMLIPENKSFRELKYRDLLDTVRRYAASLQSLGIERGHKLCIQSESCAEWAFVDWASQTLGAVVVPIYPTLPADQTQYIAKDSGAKWVVCSSQEQAVKTESIEGLQTILIGEIVRESNDFDEPLWKEGMKSIQPEDVATIIYTSGTTGNPKGAMISHQAATTIVSVVPDYLTFDHTDRFLSFLPISHVYERIVGQFLPISVGASIAYAKSLMTLANDMVATQPTVILCVPRFLEATKDRIIDAANKYPTLRKKLFFVSLSQGIKRAKGEFAPLSGVLDLLVGKKVRERMGGHIRFLVSGGAALPPHVAEFYMAFRLTVLQGYGLTETTAASCVNHPDPKRNKYWTVGEPLPGVEVRIAEDGEILLRGPSVMLGYYNLPEQTAEAIDSEGWFHTGDIGEWEGKSIKITDRKKDLLILANGKNVAPQQIENKLKESDYIQEAVLFGDGSEYVYGLIIPNFERVRKKLGEAAPKDDKEFLDAPAVKDLIKEEIGKVNKNLADFEKVKKHEIIAANFSVEGGELTPSLKVKRKVVQQRHADVLANLKSK